MVCRRILLFYVLRGQSREISSFVATPEFPRSLSFVARPGQPESAQQQRSHSSSLNSAQHVIVTASSSSIQLTITD
jgi:hypothetical protein